MCINSEKPFKQINPLKVYSTFYIYIMNHPMPTERIIGIYEGQKKGPLLFLIGAMHGNEPAGVKAINLVLKMLEVEPITNPTFEFRGKVIGLIGNVKAFNQQKRYIDQDLNRSWTYKSIEAVKNNEIKNTAEQEEIKELLDIIHVEIQNYSPEQVYFVDLHTTSSFGGIFSIVGDEEESIEMAKSLHAPVIKGMLKGIQGTLMHYFNTENMGIKTHTITFESGQHEEDESSNRAIAGIINLMRSINCVDADCVENRHDKILIEYAMNLPEIVELVDQYKINDSEIFEMKPGYENFQKISKGEVLAKNQFGPIVAENDGLILMPLYQKQGDDGFFIVKDVS